MISGKMNMRAVMAVAALMAASGLVGSAAHATAVKFTVTGQIAGTFTFDNDPPTYVGNEGGQNFYALTSATGYFSGATAANLFYMPGDFMFPANAYIQGFGSFTTGANWTFGFWGPRLPVNADGTFNSGTYSTADNLSGANVTIDVTGGMAPSAPAPMIGGGLIEALAAIAGFALARTGSRKRLFSLIG